MLTEKRLRANTEKFLPFKKLVSPIKKYFVYKIKNGKHLKYQLALGQCSLIVLNHSKGATRKILNVLHDITGASFLAIQENDKENTRFKITHQYSQNGITFEQAATDPSIYVYGEDPSIYEDLSHLKISISYTHLITNTVIRKFLEKLNLKTVVLIPLQVDKKWFGNLSICFSDIRNLTERDINNLKAIGTTIATYYTKKHFREKLEQSNKELEEALIAKDQMLSIISHDIKTPMNSILGFSNLIEEILNDNLKNETLPDQQEIQEIGKYNSVINSSTKGLLMLLNNVLLWSRSIRNKITPTIRLVELDKIYKETINQIAAMISEKDINIAIEGSKGISLSLDKEMIIIILRNIISNAIKFTNIHGKIRINTISKETETIISISDNGIGMSEEKAQNIFCNKCLESQVGTNGETGTGLGLIVCKRFTELLNGRISVESKLGVGTTFQLTFKN